MSRVNRSGQTESYFSDASRGLTFIKNLDGSTTKFYQFVNTGALTGDVRKKELIDSKGKSAAYTYSYDEKGRLVRELDPDGTVKSFFDADQSSPREEPTPKQLQATEEALLGKIALCADGATKQQYLYELGLLYSGDLCDITKALETAKHVNDRLMRFNIILHAYDYSPNLTGTQKISYYRSLSKEYPENRTLLNDLIDIRTKNEN